MFDVIWIGSGPGGYVGAIRGAQLGLKTAVIEKDPTFGGTCLNVGCIPSKALLDSSEHYDMALHHFSEHGVKTAGVELDLPTMLARKDKIVKDLTNGIAFLFKKHKIQTFAGRGKILSKNTVEVTKADGSKEILEAKNIVIATGSVPNELPTLKFDGKNILSSTEALCITKVPEHLIVVGAGVIGLELGSVWLRLGSKVTVIEYADRMCSFLDNQMVDQFKKILERQGFTFLLGTKVMGARVHDKGVSVQVEGKAGEKMPAVEGTMVLVAAGRKPFTEGLGLENIGLERDQAGRVQVDDHLRTKVPNVYAIGDVVRGPMLAHKAEEEGVAVAETMAGGAGHVNYETVPSVVYTWPEFASVGLTEEEVKKKGTEYKVGTFPFTANGRARAMGFTQGMVKVIADKKTDRVLGVHIIGPRASDMLAEAVVAMEFGASSEDIARSFHSHPTLSEVLREAALAVDGRARQM